MTTASNQPILPDLATIAPLFGLIAFLASLGEQKKLAQHRVEKLQDALAAGDLVKVEKLKAKLLAQAQEIVEGAQALLHPAMVS